MFIQINRNIFKALPSELQDTYVYEKVCVVNDDILSYEEEALISNQIKSIILLNEEYHEKYGVIQPNCFKQVDETCLVPGMSEPSGFKQVGKFLIAPFDWSWDKNGDFDYDFTLFYSLEHCKEKN
jgi:hypothetical protein